MKIPLCRRRSLKPSNMPRSKRSTNIYARCDAPLLSVVAFGQNGPVFDDLDAGKLFEDPALRRIERELGLLRFEALVHPRQAFELFDIGMRIKRHSFNQSHNRRRAVRWRRGQWLSRPFPP